MENKTSFFKALWLYKGFIIALTLLGFLLSYFVTDFVINQLVCNYEFEIITEVDPSNIFNEAYIEERLKQIDDYNKYVADNKDFKNVKLQSVSLSSGYDYKDIYTNLKYELVSENTYVVRIKQNEFKTTFVSSKGTVSEGLSKCESNTKKIFTQSLKYYDDLKDSDPINVINPSIKLTINKDKGFILVNYNNPFIIASIGSSTMLIIALIIFFIILKKKGTNYFKDISDNENVYNNPFHKSYWKNSLNAFKNVKDLAVIAILFAMMLMCKLIPIPTGFGNLGLSFTYLFFSIISMIYGPVVGIVIGLLSDVLGYFINSSGGAFFPGYTLDAMTAGFVYGIAFYKTKLSFSKCLYARMFINLVVNVIFGSLWYSIMYNLNFDQYVTYITIISLPKNLLFLLPQSILLFIVLKAMTRPLYAFGLIDLKVKENVTVF